MLLYDTVVALCLLTGAQWYFLCVHVHQTSKRTVYSVYTILTLCMCKNVASFISLKAIFRIFRVLNWVLSSIKVVFKNRFSSHLSHYTCTYSPAYVSDVKRNTKADELWDSQTQRCRPKPSFHSIRTAEERVILGRPATFVTPLSFHGHSFKQTHLIPLSNYSRTNPH